MPLIKLTFRPGVNRDQTNYSNEGGWFESNKVRFFSGFPQKIGGWLKYSIDTYVGVCRSLFNWVTNGAYDYMAIGTSKKVYVEVGGQFTDITPILDGGSYTTPTTDNCIDVSIGSKIINVNLTSHGASIGDYVVIGGVVGPIGGIPASEINAEHVITGVPTVNDFEITVATSASSTVTGAGGTAITIDVLLPIGYDIATAGYGWGVGGWGGSPAGTGWGSPSSPPIYQPLRLIHFTKYDSDLVYNVRFGDIYYWPFDASPSDRAVYLKNEVGATDVPEEVTQVLFAQDNGHLLAFGCTPFGGGDRDPLLIRWANQRDIVNWTVNDLTTAGFLRVASGSAIMKAELTYQEILVFTESSLSSLQYTGTLDVFAIQELSPAISLIGPNAVITVKNVTYWMGTDKFFIYNGRVETLPCTIRTYVFNDYNFQQTDQFFVASNEKFNEIWWFYCSSQSTTIDRYVIYNYFENVWSYGDCSDGMVRTAWCESHIRKYPQAANGENNYIYNHEVGNDSDDQPFTAFITSSDLSLDNGDNFALIRRIIPDVTFNGSNCSCPPILNLTVKPRNFPGAAYMNTNQEAQTFPRPVQQGITVPVEQYTEQVFVRARARQIGLKVESSGVKGVAWQLGIPRVDARPDGRRG